MNIFIIDSTEVIWVLNASLIGEGVLSFRVH